MLMFNTVLMFDLDINLRNIKPIYRANSTLYLPKPPDRYRYTKTQRKKSLNKVEVIFHKTKYKVKSN